MTEDTYSALSIEKKPTTKQKLNFPFPPLLIKEKERREGTPPRGSRFSQVRFAGFLLVFLIPNMFFARSFSVAVRLLRSIENQSFEKHERVHIMSLNIDEAVTEAQSGVGQGQIASPSRVIRISCRDKTKNFEVQSVEVQQWDSTHTPTYLHSQSPFLIHGSISKFSSPSKEKEFASGDMLRGEKVRHTRPKKGPVDLYPAPVTSAQSIGWEHAKGNATSQGSWKFGRKKSPITRMLK